MIKKLLFILLPLILSAQINLPLSTKQLLVVNSPELNSTTASLQAYERRKGKWYKVFDAIKVNLGRNGLAWSSQNLIKDSNEELKYEGDGKAPAGLFTLSGFFGYDKQDFKFPYQRLSSSDICVDDSDSLYYNKLLQTQDFSRYKSYEKMKRDDILYELGIFVDYNTQGLKKRGSCIFIHIQRAESSPTSGCTSMQKEKLLKLMNWLEISKKPMLLQLPRTRFLLIAPRLGLK
ncbi:MAG: hypothetical protein COA44_06710 [Arcobacter sp.]|nr:MAG: hypothetical protein COA44_06710 [Arcobacter sp.]